MDYIDAHLTEDISIKKAAQIIGTSEYHLKRTFAFIAGMTLTEYIKYRRLASANVDLINEETVTEVAIKYGYQTVEGFSRAFKKWSGYSPSEVIKNRVQKTFPRFSFYIDVKGGNSMECKLVEKEAFNIVGVQTKVPIQFEGVNPKIQELAESITEKQRKQMHNLGDVEPKQVLNASFNFDEGRTEEEGNLTHMIGFATTKENPYEDLEQLSIEAHTWAIFPNKGPFPDVLQETWANIYSEWLLSSNYEVVNAPEISFTDFSSGTQNAYSEIWIAVKEK